METLKEPTRMNTFTLIVPQGSQTALLRSLSRNMGWTIKAMPRKRKAEHIPNATTIRAIMDVEAGKVHYAKNLDDLFAQLEI